MLLVAHLPLGLGTIALLFVEILVGIVIYVFALRDNAQRGVHGIGFYGKNNILRDKGVKYDK